MRVNFTVTGTSVPDARLAKNIAHARSLGLPYMEDRAGGRALNVIGRGPSVSRHVGWLMNCDVENWACGTAWGWCRDNDIEATAVFADPNPIMADPRHTFGVKRAIVSEQCDPSLFKALEGADIRLMALEQWAVGTTAAVIAAVLGATADGVVCLYGCEGSYAETTHVNEDQPQQNLMIVRCNGRVFRTNPQMIIQTEEFCHIWRLCKSGTFLDCSGGFLEAALATGGEWELLRWDNAPRNVRDLMVPGFDCADISYSGAA